MLILVHIYHLIYHLSKTLEPLKLYGGGIYSFINFKEIKVTTDFLELDEVKIPLLDFDMEHFYLICNYRALRDGLIEKLMKWNLLLKQTKRFEKLRNLKRYP